MHLPECGCCCDYGRECCAECRSGNADHLGERGGCKRISPAVSPQACRSAPAALADGSSAPLLSMTGGAPQEKPLTFIREDKCPEFDYSGLPEQTVATLHLAENGYLHARNWPKRVSFTWVTTLHWHTMSCAELSHNATTRSTATVERTVSVHGACTLASPKTAPTGCCKSPHCWLTAAPGSRPFWKACRPPCCTRGKTQRPAGAGGEGQER